MNIHPPGSRIADTYEVAGQPLAGGMGLVYPCLDHQFQRPVALKTFRPEFLPDRVARDRFLREGTMWIDLGVHPHIVRAYGVIRTNDGQEVYLVLELVAKIESHSDASLRSCLIPGRPLPVEQSLLFALQIVWGMEYATSVIPGFVHRDLKPENVLVGIDMLPSARINRLRVTDFGLAAVLQDVRERVQTPVRGNQASAGDLRRTQLTQGFVGTPLYMAPEQWCGGPVDIRTDIYAMGCILYEMLAGQQAVTGSSLAALERAHCTGKLRPLPAGLPKPVGKVVACCLARDMQRRYPDWSALEAALMSVYTKLTGKAAPAPEPLQALQRMEQVQMGLSYNALGVSYMDIGKAEVALGYFERTWKIGHAEGERFLEAIALNHLGQTFRYLGNTERAIGLHEQALAIVQEVNNHHLKEAALAGLGMAYARLGDNQHAVELYAQALTVAQEIGDRQGEGVILGNLGTAYKNLGMYQQAIEFHEQALTIMRETGNRSQEGASLNALGITYKNLGDARRAVGYYEEALVIAREIGDRPTEGTILGNLGVAHKNLGHVRRAITFYEQALSIARETGDRNGEAGVLCNLGRAYSILGEAQQTVEYCGQALAIACETGNQWGEGIALDNLGAAYAALGDWQRSVGLHERALAIAHELGNQRGEMDALRSLGRVHTEQGDISSAINEYERARAFAYEIGDMIGFALDSFNLALLHTGAGQFRQALPLAQQAAEVWEQLGIPDAQKAQQLVAHIQSGIGLTLAKEHIERGAISMRQGRLDAAVSEFQAALRASPNNALAHNNLGAAYAEQKRWNEAIREYQAALHIESDLVEAHVGLGMIYAQLARWKDAIREFQAAIRISPNNADAHYNLGAIYIQQRRSNESILAGIREMETAAQLGHLFARDWLAKAKAGLK